MIDNYLLETDNVDKGQCDVLFPIHLFYEALGTFVRKRTERESFSVSKISAVFVVILCYSFS